MFLTAGTTLGRYEIVAPIGAGGMGEVYRARDVRLRRDVAVKVVPEAARSEHEAQVLASLNHPNIATIHGLEDAGGVCAIVMELVEGPTLADRIRGHAMPVAEALPIACQVAAALEYAHERGIVHRDLKPANVKVTPDGVVKVLDFGLAKVFKVESGAPGSTVTVTETGMILGTAAYMSPEQAKGRSVDARTDIWAFGCLLYEMLAGKKAFAGETMSDTLAAVIKSDPDWRALAANTPPPILQLIRRCLKKDPKHRLQAIGDARIAIEEHLAGDEDGAQVQAAVGRPALWTPALVAAIVAIVAALGFVFLRYSAPSAPLSYEQITFRRGPIAAARFAPDGKTIVYSAAWDGGPIETFAARLGSPEWRSLNLPDAALLAMSANGEMVIQSARLPLVSTARLGTLARVPLAGGGLRELLDNVAWADWSPDGSNLAVVHVAANKERIEYPIGKVLHETTGWISNLRISPAGDRIAFLDHPMRWDDEGGVAIVDLAGRETVLSTGWQTERGLAWAPGGDEIWFTASKAGNRSIYAVSLNRKLREVADAPGGLTLQDIAADGRVLLTRDNHRVGILTVGSGATAEHDLSWLDWSIPYDLSGDGKVLLFGEDSGGTGPLYAACMRTTDGASPPVRLGRGNPTSFSPDGRWALSIVHTAPEQLIMLPTGAGRERTLPAGVVIHYDNALWFPDGKHILVVGREAGHEDRCYVQATSRGEPKAMTPEGTVGLLVSPDGGQVLVRDTRGKFWFYAVAGGAPNLVAGLTEGDMPVQWAAGGRSLFVARHEPAELNVYRFDLASGARRLCKELTPADRTGLVAMGLPRVTRTGDTYVYYYSTLLSDLYVAQGLR